MSMRRVVGLLPALAITIVGACGPEVASDNGSSPPSSACGDGVVEELESCELGEPGCSETCQLGGELVQSVDLGWSCTPIDLETLAGGDPIVLCQGDMRVFVGRVSVSAEELWRNEWVEEDGALTRSTDLDVGPGGVIAAIGDADFTANVFAVALADDGDVLVSGRTWELDGIALLLRFTPP